MTHSKPVRPAMNSSQFSQFSQSNLPHPSSSSATKFNQSHSIKPLIAGGLMFSLIGILFELSGAKTLVGNQMFFGSSASASSSSTPALASSCESAIAQSATLSRQQLLALLAIPERESKEKVRQVVKDPYCQLSQIEIRAGVAAERDAYPLEFDPKTTLVILYENDEYAGYRFKL